MINNNPDKKEHCLIDCRVSDTQQLTGGSLQDQESAGRYLAEKNGWIVDAVFRKPHSATTGERDDIEHVLAYIAKRKREGINIRYYITKTIDRFTRMGGVEYWYLKEKLEEMGVALVDTTGIIQPKRNSLAHLGEEYKFPWSIYSPSEAAETLEAYKGKAEVRDILTRLIGAEIKLVQDGYAVRDAPDGLKNKKIIVDGKNKTIREPQPERAVYFQKMLNLRAEGGDDQETADHLNAMGFKTRYKNRWDRSDKEHPRIVGQIGGKPLTVKQLQRYIQCTEYAGVIYEKWTKHRPIKAQWEGLVSIDTFNKANRGKIFIKENTDGSVEVLHNYSPWGRVKRLRDNPTYPWKCILCPHCKSEMLGSASRGKSGNTFGGYHCGGNKDGKRAHPYFRVPQSEFEKNVSLYLDSLKFEDGFMSALELHLKDKYRNREKEILIDSSAISRTVSDLKAELAKKLEAFGFAETPTMRHMLETQVNTLDEEIKKAESTRGKIEITERSIRAFRHYAEQLMEHPSEILTNADNSYTRRALLTLFFEETPTYFDILNGTPKIQPLFRLSEQFKTNKTQLVTLQRIEL